MDVDMVDGAVFVYTIGVMLSALYLLHPGDPPINPFVLVVYTVVAVGWTAYFRWQIAPLYEDDEEDEDGVEGDGPPTVAEK